MEEEEEEEEEEGEGEGKVAGEPGMIAWRTEVPILLDCGPLRAAGTAWPQVRSPRLLAALGDREAQEAHLRAVVVEALAQVLTGMQPSAAHLAEFGEEIASAVLVAANDRLRAVGVTLLDLTMTEMELDR